MLGRRTNLENNRTRAYFACNRRALGGIGYLLSIKQVYLRIARPVSVVIQLYRLTFG